MPACATVVHAASIEQIPLAPVGGKITLVYWNICGLAQPIRYALELAGIEYVDVRIHWGPGVPGSNDYKGLWFGRKQELATVMPFPNLPYLLDGSVALSQTNTILKYIGRKYKVAHRELYIPVSSLIGEASSESTVDLILDQVADFDKESTGLAYREGLPGLKQYCSESLPAALSGWSRLLGQKPFMCGNSPNIADLKIYETLRKLRLICAQPEVAGRAFDDFPNLCAFMERIEALPAMRDYAAGVSYIARPLNNEHAKFK